MTPLSKASEEELLSMLIAGNTAAFEEIYRRFWPVLLDAAWKRLRDAETSEELVQDIFISLYVNRAQLAIHASLAAYLKGALKHKVLNEIRSRIVRNTYSHSLAIAGEPSFRTEEDLDARELERIIDEKIDQLPARCREVFILSRKQHLSHQHIAERLGISVSTVEKHIGKALRIVRTHIDDVQMITIIFVVHHLK